MLESIDKTSQPTNIPQRVSTFDFLATLDIEELLPHSSINILP